MSSLINGLSELETLPNDTVIKDSEGDVGVIFNGYVWYPETSPVSFVRAKRYLPATIVYGGLDD